MLNLKDRLLNAGYEPYDISTIQDIEKEYIKLNEQKELKNQDIILIPIIFEPKIAYQIFLRKNEGENIFNLTKTNYKINTIDDEVRKFKNNLCCVIPEKTKQNIVYHLHLI